LTGTGLAALKIMPLNISVKSGTTMVHTGSMCLSD
jgi:hypothetical protein